MLLYIFDSFIISQLQDYGSWACSLQSRWGNLLPTSPTTIRQLAVNLQATIPFLGSYLIYKIIYDIGQVLLVVASYKLVKIMPGKM